MKQFLSATLGLILAAVALPGCETDKHQMTAAAPGQVTICRKCYQEIRKVKLPNTRTSGGGTTIVERHYCDDCKSEMTIYTEDGVMKVRCPKCAPAGLACDLCAPPAPGASK